MASIVKRKSKWAVVYNCEDENGVKRQRWETFSTNADAKKRKAQIEFQQSTGTFIVPSAKTVPKAVAEMLVERRKQLDEYKDYFGDEYIDYNLVFCNTIGRPMEGQEINRSLGKLIKENDLPKVVFHSIRHTSTTYKLKLSGGDIKAVQGDTGHAQATMVTERYAHILDDDRRVNAERLQDAFYTHPKPTMPEVSDPSETSATSEKEELLRLLERSPELMTILKAMASKS